METPVIIIGGGPAGSQCSMHLSKLGVPHRLLDASHFPRDKACADILTSKAIRELKGLSEDLWTHIKDAPSFRDIWNTALSIENSHSLDIPYRALDGEKEASCVSIRRKELDTILWNYAANQVNCEALEDTRITDIQYKNDVITVISETEQMRCKLLILATGSQGRLKKVAFGTNDNDERHTAIGIRAYYTGIKDVLPNTCELYLQKDKMPGGLYIAPLGDSSFNVNMVLRKDTLLRKESGMKELMNGFIQSIPGMTSRFEASVRESTPLGHTLSLGTKVHLRYKHSTFLIGDSGGLIDLISANGIPQALISARLAAKAIASTLKGAVNHDEAGSIYEQELNNETSSDLRLSKTLSPWMSYNWFNSFVLNSMKKAHDMDDSTFLQELMYSDDPWTFIKRRFNPLNSRHKSRVKG